MTFTPPSLGLRWLRLGLLLLAGTFGRPEISAAERPNVVVILADDLGYGDVSALNPQSAWQTPHLDRLAREGRVFTDVHSASGVCTPSRYALLTGRYSWRGRLKDNVLYGYDAPLIEPGRLTLATLFRQQGYTTAMFGKWHLGLTWAKRSERKEDVDFSLPVSGGPTDHGFDEFFGLSASLDMPPYVWLENQRVKTPPSGSTEGQAGPGMWRAGPLAPDFRHGDVEARLRDRAVEFIERQGRADPRQPFFLYLALASPHTPILPSAEFAGRTGVGVYGDFVTEMDATVGAVLAALDRQRLAPDTLVIFTSDNGVSPSADLPALRRHGHDSSAGFRGHKADLYEGGHRVPFLARWPGHIPAGSSSAQLLGQVDLLATFADLLGVALPPEAAEDSISMLTAFLGEERRPRSLVHHSIQGRFAIREGSWKLLLAPDSGGWSPGPKPPLHQFQLYDLAVDPGEQTNVVAQHPAVVQRLGRQLLFWVDAGRSTPGPFQPVSYERWPTVNWRVEFVP